MPWKCKTCDESHEEQFDSCWKCGTERGGGGPIANFEIQESDSCTADTKLPCSTTAEIHGRKVRANRGIVCGEAIVGANFLQDIAAGIADLAGGRAGVYETRLRDGREIALREMMHEARALGGDAIVGVGIDYESVGDSMVMVCASGTAVFLEPLPVEEALCPDANI